MSYAWGTMVATPAAPRAIETLRIGDTVLFGSAAPDLKHLSWAPMPVQSSAGMRPQRWIPAVHLRFGNNQQLVCTGDQPLLLASGKLAAAFYLVVGRDSLVGDNGASLPVTQIVWSRGDTAIQDIRTALGPPSLNPHLLKVGGIIGGDSALQFNYPWLDPSIAVQPQRFGPRLRMLAKRLFTRPANGGTQQ